MTNPVYSRPAVLAWIVVFVAALGWSAVAPHDRATWWLEVSPAIAGFMVLALVYPRFRFTPLVAWLILAHAVILVVGGHYTYALVPAGDWLAGLMGGERNNYDKLGHLAQGLVPALVARELLLRLDVVQRPRWLATITVCIALAISAFYELVEWWVALLSGQAADAFLGTQGYQWDTQSDMAWALGGALLAVTVLAPWHSRQLRSCLRP